MSFLSSPTAEWFQFFGRFHPLIVHLPIGFLFIAGVLEVLQLAGKITMSTGVSRTILLFSGVTATLACAAGYMLSLGGGYDEHILSEHQWQGIWVAVLAWVAWLAKSDFLTDRLPFASFLYAPAVVFSVLMTFVAGHHGGALTHGSDYLSASTPEPFRGWLGMPPKVAAKTSTQKIEDINQALVFEDIIHPIMKDNCEQCHNAQKSKGKLRMDTQELLIKGGENGPIFIAGDANKSELLRRMLLPSSDEKHMPPTGKPQPSAEQIKLIEWWIEQGASFNKKVAESTISNGVRPILQTLGNGVLKGSSTTTTSNDSLPKQELPSVKFTAEDALLKQKIDPASTSKTEAIKQTGTLISAIAAGSEFLEVNYINNSKTTDAEFIKTESIQENIIWLKLSGTAITDKSMAAIAKFKNVTRLFLAHTKITDAGLKAIKSMPNLEYLNIVGTATTDAGVRELASLKNLKKLYLWQTKTTTAVSLPGVLIDHGLDTKTIETFTKIEQSTKTAKTLENPKRD